MQNVQNECTKFIVTFGDPTVLEAIDYQPRGALVLPKKMISSDLR